MRSSVIQDDADRAIFRVLQKAGQRCGRPVYRTALVKLVYLVDYIFAQHEGRTITGLTYVWDDYGPNAQDNEIVKRADRLAKAGLVRIDRGTTPSGNPKYMYAAAPDVDEMPFQEELAELVVRDVVESHADMNWDQIVSAAKNTRPIQGIRRGDVLDLRPNAARQAALGRLKERVAGRRYGPDAKRVTIQELKSRYGLRI